MAATNKTGYGHHFALTKSKNLRDTYISFNSVNSTVSAVTEELKNISVTSPVLPLGARKSIEQITTFSQCSPNNSSISSQHLI